MELRQAKESDRAAKHTAYQDLLERTRTEIMIKILARFEGGDRGGIPDELIPWSGRKYHQYDDKLSHLALSSVGELLRMHTESYAQRQTVLDNNAVFTALYGKRELEGGQELDFEESLGLAKEKTITGMECLKVLVPVQEKGGRGAQSTGSTIGGIKLVRVASKTGLEQWKVTKTVGIPPELLRTGTMYLLNLSNCPEWLRQQLIDIHKIIPFPSQETPRKRGLRQAA